MFMFREYENSKGKTPLIFGTKEAADKHRQIWKENRQNNFFEKYKSESIDKIYLSFSGKNPIPEVLNKYSESKEYSLIISDPLFCRYILLEKGKYSLKELYELSDDEFNKFSGGVFIFKKKDVKIGIELNIRDFNNVIDLLDDVNIDLYLNIEDFSRSLQNRRLTLAKIYLYHTIKDGRILNPENEYSKLFLDFFYKLLEIAGVVENSETYCEVTECQKS